MTFRLMNGLVFTIFWFLRELKWIISFSLENEALFSQDLEFLYFIISDKQLCFLEISSYCASNFLYLFPRNLDPAFRVTWQPHLFPLPSSALQLTDCPPRPPPHLHLIFLIGPGDNLTSPFPVAPQYQFSKLLCWFLVLEDTHGNVLSLNPAGICVSNQTFSGADSFEHSMWPIETQYFIIMLCHQQWASCS